MCREYIGLMFAFTVKNGLGLGQKTIAAIKEKITTGSLLFSFFFPLFLYFRIYSSERAKSFTQRLCGSREEKRTVLRVGKPL